MNRIAFCVCLLALSLAACTGDLLGRDVVAQASRGGEVAFDVVKIDDAVVETVLAQPQPEFAGRFKQYLPPPDLKIAVGDTVSVVIWESSSSGLFGNSLLELSYPAGSAARLRTGRAAPPGTTLSLPSGITTSSDTLSQMLGLGTAPGADSAAGLQQTTIGGAALPGRGDQLSPEAAAAAAQALGGFGSPGGFQSGNLPGGLQSGALAGGLQSGTLPGGLQVGGLSASQLLAALGRGTTTQRLEELVALAAQSGRPGTRIPDQQVGTDGAISIPYAGRIAVTDRTPAEVQRQIEALLATKALDPQALVVIGRSVGNSVSVAGEIVNGGRIPLSPGGNRLLQIIAAAGGSRAPVHESYVRLSRGGATATVPLATLVADPDQNIFAEPGDVLTLVRRPKTYSVFGATGVNAVGRNSAISFLSEKLSLAEALARTGGLVDERADPRAVFLLRYEPVEMVKALGQPIATSAPAGLSPVAYRLDLQEAKSYLLAKRFPMRDKDVIFVANAEVVPLYKVFQALTQLTGPIQAGAIACNQTGC